MLETVLSTLHLGARKQIKEPVAQARSHSLVRTGNVVFPSLHTQVTATAVSAVVRWRPWVALNALECRHMHRVLIDTSMTAIPRSVFEMTHSM
ncbi:hypothetical protein CKAH01_13310 [Colletotrichum kahawae]|uniref:Uncharacterized protein n=1 Tax=Colletotrichum kahawae TaxID=34407 RepID=A0AAD9YND4_COLKA|nr:hypothetical protein CKAH01_13310 [Colletotrichum kahawae]